jgi:hypothetical protein
MTTTEDPSTSSSEPQVPDDDKAPDPAPQLLPLQGASCTVDGHCD